VSSYPDRPWQRRQTNCVILAAQDLAEEPDEVWPQPDRLWQKRQTNCVILPGQALAEEADDVCLTTTTGQAELFRRGEANAPKAVNRDRKSRPSSFGGFAEGW
jgi:hypothetical protein